MERDEATSEVARLIQCEDGFDRGGGNIGRSEGRSGVGGCICIPMFNIGMKKEEKEEDGR